MTPEKVRALRRQAANRLGRRISQREAGALACVSGRTWRAYETGSEHPSHRPITPQAVELFCFKTGMDNPLEGKGNAGDDEKAKREIRRS